MEIQTLAAPLPSRPDAVPASPDPAEVDRFARALSGPPDGTLPEAAMTDQLQTRVKEIDGALAAARGEGRLPGHPADMLMVQAALLKSLIEVDLMAKTAGSLSQGINRLVNMQ